MVVVVVGMVVMLVVKKIMQKLQILEIRGYFSYKLFSFIKSKNKKSLLAARIAEALSEKFCPERKHKNYLETILFLNKNYFSIGKLI